MIGGYHFIFTDCSSFDWQNNQVSAASYFYFILQDSKLLHKQHVNILTEISMCLFFHL